ncbi:hypothetical protein [Aliiglaciecola litoralis]|uniref:Sialidase family protein n=1 Tax=Aliiglaciecola litoralis TaxID=582857 RepID=A0ABP3WZK1_9ALTE
MQFHWTKKLTVSPKHNAFTDLCEYNRQLICCYREATDHMGVDGAVRIMILNYEGQIIAQSRITIAHCDLRDPKLTVMPDGKLLLNAYARCYDNNDKWTHSHSLCWFSTDGLSWSSARWYGEKNWWVWSLAWHQDQAFGLAYNRKQQSLNWYKGNPLRGFHCIEREVLGLKTHGLGYPNEAALCFTSDETALAIVRRDADSFTAQLGICTKPHRSWQWIDLQEYIGGPAILLWDESHLIISGRRWNGKQFNTAIWLLELTTQKLQLLSLLPSAGDNSYPGLVRRGQDLYVCYYSSHLSATSDIFLAKLSLS